MTTTTTMATKIYFKNGFFKDDGLTVIPENAVEITEEEYEHLFAQQAQGKQIMADENGSPIVVEPQPSPYHEWEWASGEWVMSEENAVKQFNERKSQLGKRLAKKADALTGLILAGYPQTEIDSFYRQEKEAIALQRNPEAEAPMLRQIAEARGVPLSSLATKVLEKSAHFSALAGGIIGQKQYFEDRLNVVENNEQLTTLSQEIEQWQLSII